jgi:superfamily II DNA or RNA helicase
MGEVTEPHPPLVDELRRQVVELQEEVDRLHQLLGIHAVGGDEIGDEPVRLVSLESGVALGPSLIDNSASPEAKISFYRSLFAGRDDVFAIRWENDRTQKSGWSPAVRGGAANAKNPSREYLPLTDEVIAGHLRGTRHVGLYPLLPDDSCRLLACDFDGTGWALDALAYLRAAHADGIPAALERSRSGDGGHVWVFFETLVPAALARRLGVHLLRKAMDDRSELDLASYDRLFPTQDLMPKGSFGNLIALPLQGQYRRRGTTVFLDPSTMKPFEDQWAYFATIGRTALSHVEAVVGSSPGLAAGPGEITWSRPLDSGENTNSKMPEVIKATAGAMLGVERSGVPVPLLTALKHLASLHNPEYYEKERLRFSTWNTPRFIRCYRETMEELLLPSGLVEDAAALVADAGSKLEVTRDAPDPESVHFDPKMQLRDEQAEALAELLPHERGVLVAPPGAGKTVIACAFVAHHLQPTLIIVDRKPLVEQWRERLATYLGLGPKEIGQMGGGRNKLSGVVDVAMVQSLTRRDDLSELTSSYGVVIVDECHHVPAISFERCVRQIAARRWLGLTATPYRRDGLQALISMYCGPVRSRITTSTALDEEMPLELFVHETAFEMVDDTNHIQEVFRSLVENEGRTAAICSDVAAAAAAGRNCLVLTQWTEHLSALIEELRGRGLDPLVLQGGMGKKVRTKTLGELAERSEHGGVVLVATGSFLGEGFDCPPLDSLFLAFPIAFKGRVVQYVGRVLRPSGGKTTVEVHDYVDVCVPVLQRMHRKRLPGFASLGLDT